MLGSGHGVPLLHSHLTLHPHITMLQKWLDQESNHYV